MVVVMLTMACGAKTLQTISWRMDGHFLQGRGALMTSCLLCASSSMHHTNFNQNKTAYAVSINDSTLIPCFMFLNKNSVVFTRDR